MTGQPVMDCAVVGAGPAGLAVSAAFAGRGVDHVVLERGRVAETWRTQRWDSFRLNTPGWMNQMLGGQAPSAFAVAAEVVQRLDVLDAECPVRPGTQLILPPEPVRYTIKCADFGVAPDHFLGGAHAPSSVRGP
jgi:2-polyprenyl-6-methoxyphenol hydroxylase-like FAD-dependent oxidoreductase